jgi:hypothetical protein
MASLTRTGEVWRRQNPKRLGVSAPAGSELARDLAAASRLDHAPPVRAASQCDGRKGENDADMHQSVASDRRTGSRSA